MNKTLLLLAATVLAPPALAAPSALDRCLVGSWEPQGNAMADWVKRQNPQMAMHFKPQQAMLTFQADGSYRADASGQANARNGGIGAMMQGQFGSSGRWSASDGTLVLTQTQDRTNADMELKGPGGAVSRMKLPKGMAGGPQRWGYRCNGSRMETHIPLPGSAEVVVQPYLRK